MKRSRVGTAVLLSAMLWLPFMTTNAYAQSATGSVTIEATCGVALSSGTINFGTIAKDAQSSDVQIDFTNSGSVTANVTATGSDWTSGGTVHINGEKTKFATTDQGTNSTGIDYASKKALNSTNTEVIFGNVRTGGFTNQTNWQLEATLQNLPFSGSLSQSITFTATCIT